MLYSCTHMATVGVEGAGSQRAWTYTTIRQWVDDWVWAVELLVEMGFHFRTEGFGRVEV